MQPEAELPPSSLWRAELRDSTAFLIASMRIPAKAITHSGVFDHPTVGGRASGRREACFSP
jgi:hypothetical protein